jgi:hypothetical protein
MDSFSKKLTNIDLPINHCKYKLLHHYNLKFVFLSVFYEYDYAQFVTYYDTTHSM